MAHPTMKRSRKATRALAEPDGTGSPQRRGAHIASRPVATIKQRLGAGETLFGAFLALGSPLAAEALARAGFDWLLVDLEHGGGHEAGVLPQLLAAAPAHVLA